MNNDESNDNNNGKELSNDDCAKKNEVSFFLAHKMDQMDSPDKMINKHVFNSTNYSLIACLLIAILGIVLPFFIPKTVNKVDQNDQERQTLKYWVYSAHSNVESKTGLLKHVHLVLERIGLEKNTNKSSWSLLWSHDYPFRVLYPHLHRLKPHQKVNHFPGTGFITNKVDLATSGLKYIPKAFKLPQNKEEFLKYAEEKKDALFLEKHNQHRGVVLKNVTEIDLVSGESFVQEYVQKPFLVDGHKFDIGVYVVITSVDPLRVYWYKGDVLFRYCPAKYYPFDPKNLDKYVIGDDYLPTWEVPALTHSYTTLGFSMKDSFDIYVRSKGKDPTKIWVEVQNAISEVFTKKEHHIVDALKNYPSKDNFFEMMRFDLVLDEDLKVYLLEANMSPNLSSAHYPPNQLLYEQVLYSLFSITGVAFDVLKQNVDLKQHALVHNMISSQKNIAAWGEECGTVCKDSCFSLAVCSVCRPCISSQMRSNLLRAHAEFLHRADFRRLYPPSMGPKSAKEVPDLGKMSENNKVQYLWYQGRCNNDITWCT